MKTGCYRVRKGWFGKSILQYQSKVPIDQHCTAYKYLWTDQPFESAPYSFVFDYPKGHDWKTLEPIKKD